MVVEKRQDVMKYGDTTFSVQDWLSYAYRATHDVVGADYRVVTAGKKVTNPPKIYDCLVRYLTTPYFCEDAQYAVPVSYLGAGIESCIQTRVIIGIIEVDSSPVKGG